ncbi:U5 small nuclear ribonucleoprotein TSSC4-like [Ylistrum balloti]|uniref:U5 small nuclear ribonucleoprotein TSSC4-like n=1 Tax=Ylistrum balloti TaxID=509963 RepID=UPI002905AEFA|nr:U5 small nuclear ribonucleoprotein TSSC4-like [Ylistrum balloti]
MQDKGSPPGSSDFTIASGNDSFSDRCKDVFSCLQSLEDKHVAHDQSVDEEGNQLLFKADPTIEDTETLYRKFKKPNPPQHSSGKQDQSHNDIKRGLKRPSSELYIPPWQKKGDNPQSDYKSMKKDSDFKLPPQRFPSRQQKKIPDFKLNPSKWKKYTLEDVSNEDMSQASNTKAAFAFLEERRKLREAAEGKEEEVKADVEGGACSQGAIIFKRPNKKGGDKQDSDSTKSKFDKKNCDQFNEDDEDSEESLVIKPNVTFKSKKSKSLRSIRKRETEDDN